MAGNLVKRVMLKIVADDGDSQAKLDAISAKADELARKNPDIKVKVDSAAASAKLGVLRQELKATAAAANQSSQGGFFSRLAGLAPAIGQMSMLQKIMMGVSAATSFAEPAVAGVVVAVGGLASGLVAAGAGLGAFGLVAKANLTTATTAANAVQQAQITYNASIKSGVSQARAYQAEQVAIRQAYANLSPAQIGLSKQIGSIQNAWQSFVQSNTSGVSTILSQGAGLLPGLFKDLQGFMPPVESALHTIIGELGRGLQSSEFQSFIHDLQQNSGPALVKIAGIIGHLFSGIGGVIKAFMPEAQQMLGGLDSWTAKFAHWGQTLSSHSGFQSLMSMFKSETPLAAHTLANLGGIIKTVIADMTGLDGVGNSKTLLQIAEPFSSLLKILVQANPELVRVGLYVLAGVSAGKKLSAVFGANGLAGSVKSVTGAISGFKAGFSDAEKAADESTGVWGTVGGHLSQLKAGFTDAEAAASETTGIWGTLGGKISSALSGAGSMITSLLQKMGLMTAATETETGAQEGLDAAMDANPIGIIIVAIGALIAVFVLLWKHSAAFRDFWKAAWHGIEAVAVAAWHGIDSGMIQPIEHGIDDLIGFFGHLWADGVHNFDMLRSGVTRVVSDVIGFFERLPGDLLHALGDIGSLLLHAGENLVMGLVHGIESVAMAPVHAVESIVSDVRNLLPFSPAKRGPLSGSGSPDLAGRKIAQMIGQGITAGTPAATGPMTRLAASLAAGAHGGPFGAAPGTSGGSEEIVIRVEGNAAPLLQFMEKTVRGAGGDPAMFRRKVAFR